MAYLASIREIGEMMGFMSLEKKQTYHRINMENLLALSQKTQQETQHILREGFQANLNMQAQHFNLTRRGFEEMDFQMRQIAHGLESLNDNVIEGFKRTEEQLNNLREGVQKGFTILGAGIAKQIEMIENSNKKLDKIIKTLQSPRATEARELAQRAAINIKEALSMNEERAKRLINEAYQLLQESITIYDYDYKAHFDYGWICSFFLGEHEKAEYHFDTAVLRSLNHDPAFAVYSLRHLAETRRDLNEFSEAIEAAQEALDLDKGQTIHIQFDLARYLALAGHISKSCEYLESLINLHPEYYLQVIAEPDLFCNREIASFLQQLFDNKFKIIFLKMKDTWKQNNKSCQYLACSANEILRPIHIKLEHLKKLTYLDIDTEGEKIYVSLSESLKYAIEKYTEILNKINEAISEATSHCESYYHFFIKTDTRLTQTRVKILGNNAVDNVVKVRLSKISEYHKKIQSKLINEVEQFERRHPITRFLKKIDKKFSQIITIE